MTFFQQSLFLAILISMPVMASAKSPHSVSPRPIQRYQKRLGACIQYATEGAWSIKSPFGQIGSHPHKKFHHLVDGYRCWRLKQDFVALKKQYDNDAQSKGSLDAMNVLIHATWGETW